MAKRSTTSKPSGDAGGSPPATIVALTDAFCREHLNEEYEALCRKLAGTLARKRPSPLPSGKPETWACGIVRTIGWVNFLDDSSRKPHLKLTAIDKAFGVAESTGQGKSKAIRTMLKIRQFDHRWTLPSRMDEHPMIWMIEVNGFIVDIRRCAEECPGGGVREGLDPLHPRRPGGTIREQVNNGPLQVGSGTGIDAGGKPCRKTASAPRLHPERDLELVRGRAESMKAR